MHFWGCLFNSYSTSAHCHAFFLPGAGYKALNSLTSSLVRILSTVPLLSCLPSPWFSTPSSSPVSQHVAQYRSIKVERWMTSSTRREHKAWAQCTLICLVSECKAGSITQPARRGWGMVPLIGLSCFLISRKAKWKYKVLRDCAGVCADSILLLELKLRSTLF